MVNIKQIKYGILMVTAAGLMACGGGDSSPADISYTGHTGQAVLTADNDDTFGTTMLEGSSNSNASNPFRLNAADSDTGYAKKNLGLLEILATQFKNDIQTASSPDQTISTSSAVVGTAPLTGPCGGSISFNGSETSGSVIYSDYCVGDDSYNVSLNGTMSYTVVGSNTEFDITVKYSRFSITVTTPDDSWSETGSGEMSIVFGNGSFSVTFTNLFERDGKVYKIEDLTLNNGHIKGRLYHPDYGYVVIDTDLAFVLDTTTGEYCGGTLHITGNDGSGGQLESIMSVTSDCSEYKINHDNSGSETVPWH